MSVTRGDKRDSGKLAEGSNAMNSAESLWSDGEEKQNPNDKRSKRETLKKTVIGLTPCN